MHGDEFPLERVVHSNSYVIKYKCKATSHLARRYRHPTARISKCADQLRTHDPK